MAWVLVVVTAVLAVLVLALALLVVRLTRRLDRLEAGGSPSSDAKVLPEERADSTFTSLDGEPAAPEFVITRMGEPEVAEPAPTVPAPVFADLLLKETVVQTADAEREHDDQHRQDGGHGHQQPRHGKRPYRPRMIRRTRSQRSLIAASAPRAVGL